MLSLIYNSQLTFAYYFAEVVAGICYTDCPVFPSRFLCTNFIVADDTKIPGSAFRFHKEVLNDAPPE